MRTCKQHALKGQKPLAQGNALGNFGRKPVALKGQKLSNTGQSTKLLPLQGALLIAIIPRALPWARSFCPFRARGVRTFVPSARTSMPRAFQPVPAISFPSHQVHP